MKVKVCGMRNIDNIAELCNLSIDYIGMIFYSKSPRYVETIPSINIQLLKDITTSANVQRIGVFVNEDIQYVLDKAKEYQLDYAQLHGNENPEYCNEIREEIPVIKAFSISSSNDFINIEQYSDCCEYFLFDTKTESYGGSGKKFDWSILDKYTGITPFFLSGGISLTDVERIKAMTHPLLYGIDVNSRFEKEPGIKDIELLTQFLNKLKS